MANVKSTLTGVEAVFTAQHRDPSGLNHNGELHEHTWHVKVTYDCKHNNDAVILQNHLKTLVRINFDGQILPDNLSRAEDIADAIFSLSPPFCVKVKVTRPKEGLFAIVKGKVVK
jgi:6-pyruvoyl-tetrahydropterin synthase